MRHALLVSWTSGIALLNDVNATAHQILGTPLGLSRRAFIDKLQKYGIR